MDKQHDKIDGIQRGKPITAKRLNLMGAAINGLTDAIARPRQVDIEIGETVDGDGDSGTAIGDEVFSAGPSDITSTIVTLTDSNSDTVDVNVITQVVFTEGTSGRKMTLNLTYA